MMRDLDPGSTNLPADLCAAIRAHRAQHDWNGRTIALGGHAWNLFPEEAAERFISPSNNDCGTVRTPFLLEGLRDVVIDGQGARLLVRGTPQAGRGRTGIIDAPLVPFLLRDCRNVTIRNLTIDWATPGTCQGTCLAVDHAAGTCDVRLETTQRTWCWNSQLYLEGEGWTWPVRRLLAADPATGAILPGTGDNMGAGYDVAWTYESLGDQVVRIRGPASARPQVGCTILFWCSNHDTGARRAPAIFLERAEGVRLEDVTLHYCWAMGVIAQDSSDLAFTRLVVEPSGQRRFSLAADGTHFVNCRGELRFEACRFQNQFDDAINAHGLYHQVVRRCDAHSLRIRTLHPQHQGVTTYRSGDRVRLCRAPHLLPLAELTIASVSALNSEMQDLRFAEALPEVIASGDFVENLSAYPAITIRGCTFRWNRARGVLLNGNQPIRVEGNHFETPGSAILVESSATWGESGPISDLRITGNTFTRCTTCPTWGAAVIQASPEFRCGEGVPADLPPFHGTVTLVDNAFRDCAAPAQRLESCERIATSA
ncbi:MAG TPA: hypothetical protein DCS97_10525 [Planctomycetes bacterium]|nr:hypothetical protein [Planctomycetota bacterium]